MKVGLACWLQFALPLNVEGLENGVLHASVPALVVVPAGLVAGCCADVGDALFEVVLPAAEGLDALAPVEVTPVAMATNYPLVNFTGSGKVRTDTLILQLGGGKQGEERGGRAYTNVGPSRRRPRSMMGVAAQRGGAAQPTGTSCGEMTMLGHQEPLGRRSHTRVPSAETSTAGDNSGSEASSSLGSAPICARAPIRLPLRQSDLPAPRPTAEQVWECRAAAEVRPRPRRGGDRCHRARWWQEARCSGGVE